MSFGRRIVIFKNNKELCGFDSIQKAAKWLKDYVGYKNLPLRQVYNGIHFEEEWQINDNTYTFTENKDKAVSEKVTDRKTEVKIEATSYWTFYANSAYANLEKTNYQCEFFQVPTSQKEAFKKGQLGIIRIGNDKRNDQIQPKNPKLTPGIYAIIEILGQAQPSVEKDEPRTTPYDKQQANYCVPFKYVTNLTHNPIPLGSLQLSASHMDKHLITGSKVSTMSLDPETFRYILQQAGGIDRLQIVFDFEDDSFTSLRKVEQEYRDAAPEVKEKLSSYIEQSPISQAFKHKNKFKCQLCESLELHPYSFKQPGGDYYVEVHHVMPTSAMQAQSLEQTNLLTVCPNHHRQLHYGNVSLIENTSNHFTFKIDGQEIFVVKE